MKTLKSVERKEKAVAVPVAMSEGGEYVAMSEVEEYVAMSEVGEYVAMR